MCKITFYPNKDKRKQITTLLFIVIITPVNKHTPGGHKPTDGVKDSQKTHLDLVAIASPPHHPDELVKVYLTVTCDKPEIKLNYR